MKTTPDQKRFERYQSLINVLLAHQSFQKSDIYESLPDERAVFIGRVLNELVKDGYLNNSEKKTGTAYSWSEKKEQFLASQWIKQRVFSATIKRSPFVDRPRERLLRLGPSKLKTAERLAILIRSGLQGESAMQAGERLSTSFGDNLEKLSIQTRGELKRISKAIGTTGYCQIMAALEMGKRLAGQRSTVATPRYKIRNTVDALEYTRSHFLKLGRESFQEEFHVVLLDKKHHVIKTEQITVGLINKSLVHPREVLKPAIRELGINIYHLHDSLCCQRWRIAHRKTECR